MQTLPERPHPDRGTIRQEASRRRTFAIISHPDAGKTTLTEKFLLYAGVKSVAGVVKGKRGRETASSDWMELEKQRGISITSTVLGFTYRGSELNLLDTPGHQDFSEDTYRALTAVDGAIMVLDASKGIEPQTLKLYQVCASQKIPLVTFINKCDRPGLEPLALLDEIEDKLGLRPTPATWPVGQHDFKGVVDRRTDTFISFERTPGGAYESPEQHQALPASDPATDELALLEASNIVVDPESFAAARSTPVFFGSALWNFGVRSLLDAIVDLVPPPGPRTDAAGAIRSLEEPFAGFVFKVQANMDPNHRDRIAFIRVCSGVFERGMSMIHGPSGRPIATRYAHRMFADERSTVETAYPGDIVGLVSASRLRVGDSVYTDRAVEFPRIPSFPPEHFGRLRNRDTSRYKQLRRGLKELEEEGVVQILSHPTFGDQVPVLAACGALQFDVALWRLHNEYGASVSLERIDKTARRTDAAGEAKLSGVRGVEVLHRNDGAIIALFDDPYRMARLQREDDSLILEPLDAS